MRRDWLGRREYGDMPPSGQCGRSAGARSGWDLELLRGGFVQDDERDAAENRQGGKQEAERGAFAKEKDASTGGDDGDAELDNRRLGRAQALECRVPDDVA